MTETKQDKVFDFFQHLMFVKLISAGKSNLSDKYADMVKQGYDMAFDILKDAIKRNNVGLYNRILIATGDLVPYAGLKKQMAHPEVYPTLLQYKSDFLKKLNEYLTTHKDFTQKYHAFLQNTDRQIR